MPVPLERKLFKIGSSLAVTLPCHWVKHLQIGVGDMVEIVVDDKLIITAKKEYKLDKDLTETK
jgi:antitoxin component of MazEF toxin-antitoxin module